MTQSFDDMLSLPVILAWLRAKAAKIALGGAIFALLAVPIVALRAEVYESTATLLVFPPTFKGEDARTSTRGTDEELGDIAEMMPRVLPMELYKAIALSPPLLAQIIEQVPLDEETTISGLMNRLEVELIQLGSRSSQGVSYTQALIFRARATEPELAAKTANTWANIFKDHVDSLSAKGVGETFALLQSLHEATKAELDQAEQALAEHKKEWNLELLQAQLEAKQSLLTKFEGQLKETQVELASGEKKLAALEQQMAQEPEKKVYFRAPSDDAYWITGAQSGDTTIEPEKGLRTEEPNPVYIDTRNLIVAANEKVEGLRATAETLVTKQQELDSELDVLSATIAEESVEREHLTRESTSLKESYKLVRNEYEKGRMADRTQASDIAISGQAVTPKVPSSMRSPQLVILAFIVGLIFTTGFLALKDLSEMTPLMGSNGVASMIMGRGQDAETRPKQESHRKEDATRA